MLAQAGYGEHIEQFEIIEALHVHKPCRFAIGVFQGKPTVELELCLPNGRFDTGNYVVEQDGIITLGYESIILSMTNRQTSPASQTPDENDACFIHYRAFPDIYRVWVQWLAVHARL